MPNVKTSAIVLAAGKGSRFKSETPKCAQEILGRPMASWVIQAAQAAGVLDISLVVGHGRAQLIDALSESVTVTVQENQLGTGDAARVGLEGISSEADQVIILAGDTPLLTGSDLSELLQAHSGSGASAIVLAMEVDDPKKYGRILTEGGRFIGIIEHADATDSQKAIRVVNSGVYVFDVQKLRQALPKLTNKNAQGEYYLTDVFATLIDAGESVSVHVCPNADHFMGVNDPWELAEASRVIRTTIIESHARQGVRFLLPETTTVGPHVTFGKDCVVEGNVVLLGEVHIGNRSIIGCNSVVTDAEIGSETVITASYLRNCKVGNRVKIGPFANIRPHTEIGDGSKVGNFVELKNTRFAESVSASHLAYIGDASIGKSTNIGAGTITCNYDGFEKHHTAIGSGAFIGSNSTIVAPRVIGNDAIVAAGSVVTEDVGNGDGAFGRARTEIKQEWATKWRQRRREMTLVTKESKLENEVV